MNTFDQFVIDNEQDDTIPIQEMVRIISVLLKEDYLVEFNQNKIVFASSENGSIICGTNHLTKRDIRAIINKRSEENFLERLKAAFSFYKKTNIFD